MSQIIAAYLKHMHRIHESRPICLDSRWAIKILYEWMQLEWNDGTDIQRDIVYHAERIEPDKTKWDISKADYQEALAELLKENPRLADRGMKKILEREMIE
jgi:hypothetical protein